VEAGAIAILPAWFAHCPECRRLLIVNCRNVHGCCAAPCPGLVDPSRCLRADDACVLNGRFVREAS
jgi:hypothetical protein